MNHLTGEEVETPEVDPHFIQEVAAGLVPVVEGISQLLRRCHARLLVGPDQKAMLEGEKPCDLPTDLRGSIECLINDCLHHAARLLKEMAEETEESLARRWRSHNSLRALGDREQVGGGLDQEEGNHGSERL